MQMGIDDGTCIIPCLQKVGVMAAYLVDLLPAPSYRLGMCRRTSRGETLLSFCSPSPCVQTCLCPAFVLNGGSEGYQQDLFLEIREKGLQWSTVCCWEASP